MADLGATISSVSGAVDQVSGSLSSVSSAAGGLSGAVGAAGSFLSSLYGALSASKLPLNNILSSYATYDYIIGLSALTVDELNNPDSTYMSIGTKNLICKTGGIEPNNRIQTSYGKFDFFIDNLTVESVIGMVNQKGSFTSTLTFSVFEPYSLGVFMLSIQQAAYQAGFENWRDAPFLISVQFRGNKENGSMESVVASTRYIPIKLSQIQIKTTEKGTNYEIEAYVTSGQAYSNQYAAMRVDATVKGKTVQEVLQTGEQSLQAVVNRKLKEYVTNGTVAVADEILILFPTKIESASSTVAGAVEAASAATINPGSSSAGSLYSKLGVATGANKTPVQSEADCNSLGKTSMGYDLSQRGDSSSIKENAVYQNGVWVNGNITSDPKEGSLRFSQKMDIPTIINQVMTLSDYPENALKSENVDPTYGMRTWWRIDTQVYYVDSKENLKKTGTYPRVIVYRIIPYKAHTSKTAAVGTKAPGTDNLKKVVVKNYDYIYTGKNSEVIKFDIDFSVNFAQVLAADAGFRNQDDITSDQNSDANQTESVGRVITDGQAPSTKAGTNTTMLNYSGLKLAGDYLGGGGQEKAATRAARMFHQALTNPMDMYNLSLDIMGDPFWIPQSGLGNYTAKETPGIKDLNNDGSVSYQSSEVHIYVNFRSPLDINQATGLYTFGGLSQNAPVIAWTGLYNVNQVTSSFKGGVFRQNLRGFRLPMQEAGQEGTSSSVLNSNNPPKK